MVEEVSPTFGRQDGTIFDLYNTLDSLRMELFDSQGFMTECPVCLDPTGVVLNARKRRNTTTCRRCKNISIWIKMGMGNWKVKSEMGIMYISKSGKRYRHKNFEFEE